MEHGIEEGQLSNYPTFDEVFHEHQGSSYHSSLIEEVPNFKKFIENGIANRENTLLGHTKAQQFKFYVNAMGCPIMKYKLLCTDDD